MSIIGDNFGLDCSKEFESEYYKITWLLTSELNPTVWAKNESNSTSTSRYTVSEHKDVNRDIKAQCEQTYRNQDSQTSNNDKVSHSMSTPNPYTNCNSDSGCAMLDKGMGMLDNILKDTFP